MFAKLLSPSQENIVLHVREWFRYVKVFIPIVTIFRDRAFQERIKAK